MVVKILYKLYPKEGLTRDEFVDRWLKVVQPFGRQARRSEAKLNSGGRVPSGSRRWRINGR